MESKRGPVEIGFTSDYPEDAARKIAAKKLGCAQNELIVRKDVTGQYWRKVEKNE